MRRGLKKIAIDVRMMWSSGIGSYIRNLIPGVMTHYPSYQFYLLGRTADMERCEGFNQTNTRWIEVRSNIFTISEQLEIYKKIPNDTNLFWVPHYNFQLLYRGKWMATIHDVLHLAMGKQVPGPHRWLYAQFMFRRLARKAHRMLCVSSFTRDELTRWTHGDPDLMRVIHNGVDSSWFEIVKGPKSPHPKPYLLFVGNVKPHKNLVRLLKAFTLLKDRIPHDLVLVGKKEGFIIDDDKVFKEAEQLGDRVHFTGLIDEKILKQYYVHAGLMVFPSLYEGFGLPPLEAMACGCPVAVSRTASLPEVCADAVLYFDPFSPKDMAEKIRTIISDPKVRDTLVQKGLLRAKQFSWDRSVLQTCQVIDELLI
jgi:glycosyltransferase involved in cell wall biosynthesis